jgi:hypothetical protein
MCTKRDFLALFWRSRGFEEDLSGMTRRDSFALWFGPDRVTAGTTSGTVTTWGWLGERDSQISRVIVAWMVSQWKERLCMIGFVFYAMVHLEDLIANQ